MSEPLRPSDPRPAERLPHLVVVAGFGIGRVFPIGRKTLVGRDPNSDILLPYWTVSSRHALLSHRDGVVLVEDLGSRNGTFVGVDKIKTRELAEGDVLAIGDSIVLKLVYVAERHGEPAEAYRLDPDGMAGVVNTASLLDRLRTEQTFTQYQNLPLVLVFFRVDGLGGFEDDSLVEEAMRRAAIAIRDAMKGETILARSADGEFTAMARTTVETARQMADDARAKARRQGSKRSWRPVPFTLAAAIVPLAPDDVPTPESILKAARESAYEALAGVVDGVVTVTV
jgi:GGDEF domain-containing protein